MYEIRMVERPWKRDGEGKADEKKHDGGISSGMLKAEVKLWTIHDLTTLSHLYSLSPCTTAFRPHPVTRLSLPLLSKSAHASFRCASAGRTPLRSDDYNQCDWPPVTMSTAV